jgi:hypothetical protein
MPVNKEMNMVGKKGFIDKQYVAWNNNMTDNIEEIWKGTAFRCE